MSREIKFRVWTGAEMEYNVTGIVDKNGMSITDNCWLECDDPAQRIWCICSTKS